MAKLVHVKPKTGKISPFSHEVSLVDTLLLIDNLSESLNKEGIKEASLEVRAYPKGILRKCLNRLNNELKKKFFTVLWNVLLQIVLLVKIKIAEDFLIVVICALSFF